VLIERTRATWEPRYEHVLTDAQARNLPPNVGNHFQLFRDSTFSTATTS